MSAGSLAACAYDWVGGNFPGLKALQTECSQVASTITGADRALSRQVAQIVGAGGWSGSAADAFTSAWDRDSTAGAQLAGAWTQIGTIAANLAADLASLENALEQAAYQLERQGVAVDPADGTALPGTTANGLACPSPQVAVNNARLASQYTAYRTNILAQASAARAQAALALNAVTESMLPAQKDWGDPVNGLDAVRGLWAVPTSYRREVTGDLAAASKNVDSSQRALYGLVSNGAALGTGIAIGTAIGAGSVAAVAAGVVVGGAFAVGVGDFVHNAFQENWAGDIQAYGVAGGLVHGLGDTASATGHDIAHLASDLNPF